MLPEALLVKFQVLSNRKIEDLVVLHCLLNSFVVLVTASTLLLLFLWI